MKVSIVGAGLAGSEAALIIAKNGIEVDLFEMRPKVFTPAHKTDKPAELVCSNSLKSDELPTAHAILKYELMRLKSPLLQIAYKTRVPAAVALAVDRKLFSIEVLKKIQSFKNITYKIMECDKPPIENYDFTVIATGPLTSPRLTNYLVDSLGAKKFNFYDATAPIISADSIDTNTAFFADRWNKGGGDYLNCPFNKEQYDKFYNALLSADLVKAHDFENAKFFEMCLPIEVAAKRGYDVMRFSMMKPVGITNPENAKQYFAVCQLRKENANASAYNMVGFQTRMTITEQKKVFRLIPGLENAEFLRFGSIHRNSYIDSPQILSCDLSFKNMSNLFIAGQLCGNEGYTESIATGHFTALSILNRIKNSEIIEIPNSKTAIGALLKHITRTTDKFTPSNINFSLFEEKEEGVKLRKNDKKEYFCKRAKEEFEKYEKYLFSKELLF
ncbi:MAG: methylenetetrahydrofolate--tRNA-(uracil(54)-C(5))-methyltransferase (FADH(2)-oxidizing) TrmFO [Chitinispirillales bacterium]|jgi:methylenetetrahydrofolate--tRNA-(uracil-5-)-methyltransferase|nr:methylenetetrahydrofolate--tRNA-(uracil(54)-C(5))-methyltransferase (FADH(2)-oxidizing) TrmFO [Chitinispirillales bacterium]